jgi:hypothetical protein
VPLGEKTDQRLADYRLLGLQDLGDVAGQGVEAANEVGELVVGTHLFFWLSLRSSL